MWRMALIGSLALATTVVAAQEDIVGVEIVTNVGTMTVELWPRKAPNTVQNFLERVDEDFYDGLIFHRVIANFMIQGGGFDTDMIKREPPQTVVNESSNGERNVLWTIAMARRSDPDSATTQFYINAKDNPRLDAHPGKPGYTVFGKLTAGMDVAEAIELTETRASRGFPDMPAKPVVIETIRRVEQADD